VKIKIYSPYFINQNIPCLGIEPTEGPANISKEKGVDVICDFFNTKLAKFYY